MASKSTTSIEKIERRSPEEQIVDAELSEKDQAAFRRATLKFDLIVIPIVSTFFLLSFLDRVNIGNARLAGFQTDLGLTNAQYSTALTVTYVPYILIELPSNLLLKRIGPNILLPSMLVLWGIVTTMQGLVTSYSGLLACRFFLGLCEGGLLPGIVLYLSGFYKRHQLQLRIAMLYSAVSLAGAFSGLLATAIVLLDGRGGKKGWAWIFILEGLFTVVFGLTAFFTLPRSPTTSRFLSQEEKVAVSLTLSREWMNGEEEEFSWSAVLSTFKSPHIIIFTIMSFFNGTAVFGLAFFSPSIVAGLGYTKTTAQLMSVPPYACSFVASIAVAYLSDRYKKRGLAVIVGGSLATVGYGIYLGTSDLHAGYASLFLQAMGVFICAPTISVWIVNNVAGHYRRATAVAFTLLISNCGGILSTWIFSDPPRYKTGTSIDLTFAIGWTVLAATNLVYFYQQNKKKRQLVEANGENIHDPKERQRLGDEHPLFTYTL